MAPLVLSDFSAFDRACMARALALAEAAAAAGEVPVGAVIADRASERILGDGANAQVTTADPVGHAEIVALRAAAKAANNYRLPGATLYVTLEPCAMCAGAIAMARIETLIWGADDPKGGGVAHGPKLFEQPTIHWRPKTESGLLATESAALLRAFFRARRD
jgi:tRNA(Arg) A34 adenosine deaminase TadA